MCIRDRFPEAEITFQPGMNFLRLPVPVPATALSHGTGEPGLLAEVFSSADLSGTPISQRVDAKVDFDFDTGVVSTKMCIRDRL